MSWRDRVVNPRRNAQFPASRLISTVRNVRPEGIPMEVRQLTFRGVPHSTSIRLLNVAVIREQARDSSLAILNAAKFGLQNSIDQMERNYRVVSRNRQKGVLVLRDQTTSKSTVSMIQNAESDITTALILSMFEKITQSDSTMTVEDIEVEFYFDIISNARGSGGNVKVPSWWPNQTLITWKEHVYEGMYYGLAWRNKPINCAVYAITHLKMMRRGDRERTLKEAVGLQIKWGVGEEVGLKDFETYVNLFPKERIVVITKVGVLRTEIFTGKEYELEETHSTARIPANTYYFYFDIAQKHYAAISKIQPFVSAIEKTERKWCHKCIKQFPPSQAHECRNLKGTKKKNVRKLCEYNCGEYHVSLKDCERYKCRQCNIIKVQGEGFENPFRCLVWANNEEIKEFSRDGANGKGKLEALIVWDIESQQKIEVTRIRLRGTDSYEFPVNENGKFVQLPVSETGELNITLYKTDRMKHEPNLICWKDVFSGESGTFSGNDCILQMLHHFSFYNNGNNRFVAHNSSGYDSRFVIEKIGSFDTKYSAQITNVGAKVLRLGIGNGKVRMTFIDSMKHLPGSLASLAKSLAQNTRMEKGYFPHLFNTVGNEGYVGELPDKKYFCLPYSMRTETDYVKFNEWYDERKLEPWNFKEELLKYCQNDVEILAEVVRTYHEIQVRDTKISPWHFTTAPGFVHEYYKRDVSSRFEHLRENPDDMSAAARITEIAKSTGWAVLRNGEYYFCRAALRGGRTDAKCIYYELTPQQIEEGWEIIYADINSMYPSVQMKYDYPTGTPEIFVWEHDFLPCKHHLPPQGKFDGCRCDERTKFDPLLRVHSLWRVTRDPRPEYETLRREPDFFGIICVDVTPNAHLFTPLLTEYDQKEKKNYPTNRPLKRIVLTTVELEFAVDNGYKVTKIYRYDKYTRTPSYWRESMAKLYIGKMCASRDTPSDEEREEMVRAYEEEWGMGDLVREAFEKNLWKKDAAYKQVCKIALNCGWGKHAQRPVLGETIWVDEDIEEDPKLGHLMANLVESNWEIKKTVRVSDTKTLLVTEGQDGKVEKKIHNYYLPVAVFVTAYARIELLKELLKLDTNALYHDTDSIIYVKPPGGYEIPIQDGMLGAWELEDYGTITNFVAIAPKTYGLKYLKGGRTQTMVKAKGLSQLRASDEMFNFEVLKKIALDGASSMTPQSIVTPQMNFMNTLGKGTYTSYTTKQITFDPNNLKGELGRDMRIYPFGYVARE